MEWFKTIVILFLSIHNVLPRGPPASNLRFMDKILKRFKTSSTKRPSISNNQIMTWDKYHRLDNIYNYMHYLQAQYPHIAEVIDIGRSVQKRPMLLLKIGTQQGSDKPAIVIEAGKFLVNSHFGMKLFLKSQIFRNSRT